MYGIALTPVSGQRWVSQAQGRMPCCVWCQEGVALRWAQDPVTGSPEEAHTESSVSSPRLSRWCTEPILWPLSEDGLGFSGETEPAGCECVHTNMQTCVHTRTCTQARACMHTCPYTPTQTCIHTYIHTWLKTYCTHNTHTCIPHMDPHTHIHINTYTYIKHIRVTHIHTGARDPEHCVIRHLAPMIMQAGRSQDLQG